MKKIILSVIMYFIIICCSHFEKEERILLKKEGDSILKMNIPRVGCKKCQKIIEYGLSQESGVRQSILDLNSKNLLVAYIPELTSPEILEKRIDKLTTKIPCK